VGKVKEIKVKPAARRGSVTGVAERRGVAITATKPARMPSSGTMERGDVPGTVAANGGPGAKSGSKKKAKGSARTRTGRPVVERREIKVRELVPEKVCGPRTRVQQVFRVEERVNGSSQTHLVFNDRHGWYCEHGTDCPAVGAVRKSGKSEAARKLAWTTNGRMRE